MRYKKKSDWGDYWATNDKINQAQLIKRSFEILSENSIRLCSDKNRENIIDYLFPQKDE